MFTAILWDYDGTLANTPVKNLAVTKAVLGRLPGRQLPLAQLAGAVPAHSGRPGGPAG